MVSAIKKAEHEFDKFLMRRNEAIGEGAIRAGCRQSTNIFSYWQRP